MKSQPDDMKQIRVSEKRQITIPKSFFDQLGVETSVICELQGNEIVLRPTPTDGDFSEEVLKDLVQEGYEGDQLLTAFHQRKAQIRPAVGDLIAEADQAAEHFSGNGNKETDALFGDVRE